MNAFAKSYEEAKRLGQASQNNPHDIQLAWRTSFALHEIGMFQEAYLYGKRALYQMDEPSDQDYLYMVYVASKAHKFDEANAMIESVGTMNALYWALKGVLAQLLNDMEMALYYYNIAYAKDCCPQTSYNLALALLVTGRWQEGWKAAREFPPPNRQPKSGTPYWRGEDVEELWIANDQGIGDTICFARFIPELLKKAKKVHWTVAPQLKALMQFNYPEVNWLADKREHTPATIDAWTGMMHMVATLSPEPEQMKSAPYLDWCETGKELRSEKPILGICWQGNVRYGSDHDRSIPIQTLDAVLPYLGTKYTLQSLQFNGNEYLPKGIAPMPKVKRLHQTLMLIESCDAVLSVDTSVAHLAGAIGKPVFMLNRFSSDWRWGLEGEKTFWYDSMTILRQRRPVDWAGALSLAVEKLMN